MKTARTRTFHTDAGEAVHLPPEVAFGQPDLELTVVRAGDMITLHPARPTFDVKDLIAELQGLAAPSYVQERDIADDFADVPGLQLAPW